MAEADKYEVLEKIGHGSFGIIRKVRRKSDGHILCRKEISYSKMSQKEREQLQAELSILKDLRHPNIVAYYERDHLKASSDVHLYMEYCGNGDLGQVIKKLKNKSQIAEEEFVWSMFSQLVTALYRCHYGEDPPDVGKTVMGLCNDAKPIQSKKSSHSVIIHRDLKPENVFLGEDNSVKLGDFGLSKIMPSQEFASTYVGTPFYMSPEICGGERYSEKSDIWSLGCIMYELCARDPPFNARTHLELIQKIKSGRFPPLASVYSVELQKVISSCLRVNDRLRPTTAELLNHPMVKLMRKEQEVVTLGKALKAEKDLITKSLNEANERLGRLEADKQAYQADLDASLRREWEVRARLEIDRQVKVETENLQKLFEAEVMKRVEIELERRSGTAGSSNTESQRSSEDGTSRPQSPQFLHRSSTPELPEPAARPQSAVDPWIDGEQDDQQSLTDLSCLSLDSPLQSRGKSSTATTLVNSAASSTEPKSAGLNPPLRRARQPLSRARTVCADPMPAPSPMDVHMADPSPMSIAGLSLSPRRLGKVGLPGAPNFVDPPKPRANIFATAAAAPGLEEVDEDEGSDFEDAVTVSPSLPRAKSSSKLPLTGPPSHARVRPNALRQQTAPIPPRAQPVAVPARFAGRPPMPARHAVDGSRPTSTPPRASRASNTFAQGRNEGLSPVRGANTMNKKAGDALTRPLQRGALSEKPLLHGRTIVELAQPGSRSLPEPAVWDGNDIDAPSPFKKAALTKPLPIGRPMVR